MRRVELTRVGRRRKAFVQAALQALALVLAGLQIVARQLEEGIGDLEHQDVRVAMVVHNKNALDGAPHTEVFIVVLEALQASRNRGILFRLRFLGAGVIALGRRVDLHEVVAYLKVKFDRGYLAEIGHVQYRYKATFMHSYKAMVFDMALTKR